MKISKAFVLAAAVLAFVACGGRETYITYDPVEMHQAPSQESALVVKMLCAYCGETWKKTWVEKEEVTL